MTTITTHREHTRRIHAAGANLAQAEALFSVLYEAAKATPSNWHIKTALWKAQELVSELEHDMTHLMDRAIEDGMDPEDFS